MGDTTGGGITSKDEASSSHQMEHPALQLPIRQRDRSRVYSMSLSTESPVSCWRACSNWTGKQRLTVFALASLDFCGFACLSVMGPFFPTEADKKGVSQHVTGLIFSCYAFTAFLFAPVWGKLVPRLGPKFVLMTGGTIAGIACIGFGLLYWIEDVTTFVVTCFVVRIIEAMGFAAFNTAVFTTVAKMFPETMGTVMATLEIAIGAGLAIGPVIGSGMFALGGYVPPFISLGVLLLTTVVFLYFAIPSAADMRAHGPNDDDHRTQKSSWSILSSYSAVLVCFTIAANAMGIAFLIPILAFHVGEIGIGEDKAGLMFMCHLGMYAIFAPLSGHLSDRYPTRRFLLIGSGLLVFAVGHLIVGPSPIFGAAAVNTLAVNIIGLIVIGIGSAFALVPTFPALIGCAVDRGFPDGISTYALMGGLWNSVCALGDMVGPTLAASINEVYGFAVATTVCGALLLMLGIMVVAYHYAKHMRFPSPRVDKALAKYPDETERLLSGNGDTGKL